jgi:hypothetical protein
LNFLGKFHAIPRMIYLPSRPYISPGRSNQKWDKKGGSLSNPEKFRSRPNCQNLKPKSGHFSPFSNYFG